MSSELDERQENILEAMRLANPDTPGDLMRKLWEIDPDAAFQIEILCASREGLGDVE